VVAAALASVIVPTLNGAHLLPACLDSLLAQTYEHVEVIVADGASTDATAALVAERYPAVRLLTLQRNRGFSGNVNAGIRAARGDVLLLLNNDAQADPDWVATAMEVFERNREIGSVASKVLYSDRLTINSAGDVLCRNGSAGQRGNGQLDGSLWDAAGPVFGAMGGAAAYRRAMLADTGLFDEAFFMYLEDVDLAFRAQLRGWICWYQPLARVYHRGGASGGGPLESYFNGRNLIRLWAKDLPSGLLRVMFPSIVRFQMERARAAAAQWRGRAARSTLRGQLVGLAELPLHLAARGDVQRRKRLSDGAIYAMLA
jgi:GT2 family glycosyltransferase